MCFGAISPRFATLQGATHVALSIILDGLFELPEEIQQRAPLAGNVFKYVGVALLLLIMLNMLIVVLMEAFDAVRAAQTHDKYVDNSAGELLQSLPGWRPLRRGVYSPWHRFQSATPASLMHATPPCHTQRPPPRYTPVTIAARPCPSPHLLTRHDLLFEPHTCGVRTMLLWDAMTAAEQAAEEREEEEAEGEEGEEGDARMLTLEKLAQARPPLSISRRDRRDAPASTCPSISASSAQALDLVQPGLRGFAKAVMQTFGMVPETEAEHRHERHSLARSSHSGGGAHRHPQVERMRSMRSTVIPFHDLSPPHRYAIPQLPPATRQAGLRRTIAPCAG